MLTCALHSYFRLNNALALTSYCINEPNDRPGNSAWAPTVSVQGRLYSFLGPLEAAAGHQPSFAQLYVYDPAVGDDAETDARCSNLHLPQSTTAPMRARLHTLMNRLQRILRRNHSYVSDFVMAAEILSTDGVDTADLFLSRDTRPADAHERSYDPPSGGPPRTFQVSAVSTGLLPCSSSTV